MRHRVYGKHFGRNKNERQALFKGLVHSLFSYGTIQLSEARAKAIKGLVDKIINSVRKNTFSEDLNLSEKIKNILPKLGTRTSGYTSMMKMGTRQGDQTMIVKMSLIGAEEIKPIKKESRIKNLESSKKTEEPRLKKGVKKLNS